MKFVKKFKHSDGIEFQTIFRNNKFTGDLDISHWKLISNADSLSRCVIRASFQVSFL